MYTLIYSIVIAQKLQHSLYSTSSRLTPCKMARLNRLGCKSNFSYLKGFCTLHVTPLDLSDIYVNITPVCNHERLPSSDNISHTTQPCNIHKNISSLSSCSLHMTNLKFNTYCYQNMFVIAALSQKYILSATTLVQRCWIPAFCMDQSMVVKFKKKKGLLV